MSRQPPGQLSCGPPLGTAQPSLAQAPPDRAEPVLSAAASPEHRAQSTWHLGHARHGTIRGKRSGLCGPLQGPACPHTAPASRPQAQQRQREEGCSLTLTPPLPTPGRLIQQQASHCDETHPQPERCTTPQVTGVPVRGLGTPAGARGPAAPSDPGSPTGRHERRSVPVVLRRSS